MKSVKFISSFSLIWVVLLFSCAPVRVVSTQKKEGINYEGYKSFNFMDVSYRNDSMVNVDIEKFRLLKATIAKEMQDLGYVQAPHPNLWVNIGIVIEPKVQTRTTDIREAPIYIGQRRYHWESEEVVVGKYEEGTVSIDIIDADRNEQIWEGVAAGTITGNLKKLEKRINKAMELLFKKFPT